LGEVSKEKGNIHDLHPLGRDGFYVYRKERIMQLAMNIGGIFLGGLITLLVTQRYYRRAAQDLEKEAIELRRLINYMLLGMEDMGWVKLNRGMQGNPRGFVYTIKAKSGVLTLSGSSAALVKTSHKREDSKD
jgi:hypothetical protein